MKLLMFGVKEFWYKTFSKTIENEKDFDLEEKIENAVVVFLNAEKEDENRMVKVISEAIGNIKWLAKKNDTNNIVLHSFAHLSDSKSSIEFAKELISKMGEKLSSHEFNTTITPFGYFLEFKIHVKGESIGKVWKAI